jgi:hypothetical protein
MVDFYSPVAKGFAAGFFVGILGVQGLTVEHLGTVKFYFLIAVSNLRWGCGG